MAELEGTQLEVASADRTGYGDGLTPRMLEIQLQSTPASLQRLVGLLAREGVLVQRLVFESGTASHTVSVRCVCRGTDGCTW